MTRKTGDVYLENWNRETGCRMRVENFDYFSEPPLFWRMIYAYNSHMTARDYDKHFPCRGTA